MKKILIILSCFSIFLISSCSKKEVDTPQQNDPTLTTMPAGLEAWANLFDGEGVGAIHGHGTVTFIFNLSGTKYAWFENEQIVGIRNLKAANSHFKNLPLETVGAIGSIYFREIKNSIMVYNAAGTKYTLITPKNMTAEGAFNDTEYFSFSTNTYTPYDMWDDGSCPFNAIGAIYLLEYLNSEKISEIIFFNKEGVLTSYRSSYSLSSSDFGQPKTIDKLYLGTYGGGYLGSGEVSAIGAISEIKLSATNRVRVLFTGDGKQFKLWKYNTYLESPLYNLY